MLIVEDDPTFAGLLLGMARSAGLKGVLSTAGSGTVALARKLAVILHRKLADGTVFNEAATTVTAAA
ncbi:hypothetical protein EN844_30650 [Mesorhizobium sp. M3A.F.Ca.ET.201.01.1.1]|nr:hypothetical protein EN844_30650 [Mesorhizobium sp. M3A.F.Ca.ET.201.01.1.1]